ncbi:MAG: stage II sporulation protein P [Firmicutes bacterium]|nr:stage II sporulation protein P [Bacillota bacterium]
MQRRLALQIAALIVVLVTQPVAALDLTPFDQHGGKDYYTIKDETGKIVSKLASLVSVGDYLITEDDSGYRIISVDKFEATAKYDGKVDLEQPGWVLVQKTGAITGSRTAESIPTQANDNGNQEPKIGIYFTHSEESYVPNSGTHQEKKGDIYQVGDALAKSLEQNGVKAKVSETLHHPRDANSYNRSRSTALKLLKERPAILVDVHRDGIPDPNYYRREVKGKPIAQVRIVVGKQNANRSVNFDFAKRIKAKANEMFPGLVKEIFWAKGNYNQDLAPRAILLEFGTHTNRLERAQAAAEMMGKVLASMVGVTAPQAREEAQRGRAPQQPPARGVSLERRAAGDQSGGWTSALWLLGIAVVGFVGYALVNSKGLGGIKYMLSKFRSKEMAGFFGQVGKTEKHKREIKIPPEEEDQDKDKE